MHRHTRLGQIPTRGNRPALILLLTLLLPVVDAPATVPSGPTLSTPTTSNLGANQTTLDLQSDRAGTGWFTLLAGCSSILPARSAPCLAPGQWPCDHRPS